MFILRIFHRLPNISNLSHFFLLFIFFPPLFNKSTTCAGIERRISHHNFYFNETKGFYCLRTEMGDSKCLRETKGRRHPDVDPKVISKLRKFFAEHNQKFYELVGEDLGWPEEQAPLRTQQLLTGFVTVSVQIGRHKVQLVSVSNYMMNDENKNYLMHIKKKYQNKEKLKDLNFTCKLIRQ